jgi:hypothetical protein
VAYYKKSLDDANSPAVYDRVEYESSMFGLSCCHVLLSCLVVRTDRIATENSMEVSAGFALYSWPLTGFVKFESRRFCTR